MLVTALGVPMYCTTRSRVVDWLGTRASPHQTVRLFGV